MQARFPQRTVEGIKCARRQASYRDLIAQLHELVCYSAEELSAVYNVEELLVMQMIVDNYCETWNEIYGNALAMCTYCIK